MIERMRAPPLLQAERTATGERARASGDWTVAEAATIEPLLQAADRGGFEQVDASAIGALDSTGAMLLLRAAGASASPADFGQRIQGLNPQRTALLKRVFEATDGDRIPTIAAGGFRALLAHIGETVLGILTQCRELLGFLGLLMTTIARIAPHPARWRMTSVVFHLEQTGLNAVPIVALLSFLVGAVVAYLGATVLQEFGAGLYTVELIGYAFMREFGGLLAAILVAGRSGSAFTAQIGAMKNREEIDALETIGLDPVEVLVLPRLAALLIALPILSFIAMMAGILGGMAVGATSIDIAPTLFVTRLQESIPPVHFWVGLVKAPVFALAIAMVGCLEGFKVSGSAESVGAHTTSSVVQSIFLVILLDAIFAVLFMKLDL